MDVKVNVPPVPPEEVAVGLTAVGVRVNVAVADRAIVGVRVGVGPEDCVGVRVGVAVDALEANVITSCGGLLPSREENSTLSLLSPSSTKLYVPLPVNKDVTSYSTQVLVAILPRLSSAPLVCGGRLFHVMPVSDQLLPVA